MGDFRGTMSNEGETDAGAVVVPDTMSRGAAWDGRTEVAGAVGVDLDRSVDSRDTWSAHDEGCVVDTARVCQSETRVRGEVNARRSHQYGLVVEAEL